MHLTSQLQGELEVKMNKFLKWILWIIGVLVVVAVLFGIGYFAFTHWNAGGWMMAGRGENFGDGDGRLPWRNMPMHPGLMRPGGRFFGFSILGFILGGLFRLAILVLIIAGIIALIRYLTRSYKVVPVAPTTGTTTVAAAATEGSKTCPNCGRSVQADWQHCPYCGADLA
jgi:hypothetical protein